MRNFTCVLVCLGFVIAFCGCEQQTETPEQTPESAQVPEVEQAAGPLELTIHFETTTTEGRYSPRNVHAVWVEKADGTFIKTLDLWGQRHARQLSEWMGKIADMNAEVQARTGATEEAYGAYTSLWDMKDAEGNEVPDGDYIIRFEMTSDNAPRNNYHRASVPFTKSDAPATTEPVSEGGYQNIVLEYQVAAAE